MKTITLTVHPDKDAPSGLYVLVTSGQAGAHPANAHREAFAIDGNVTIHTVESMPGTTDKPDWSAAGEVEPSRASNPGLCAHVQEVLEEALSTTS